MKKLFFVSIMLLSFLSFASASSYLEDEAAANRGHWVADTSYEFQVHRSGFFEVQYRRVPRQIMMDTDSWFVRIGDPDVISSVLNIPYSEPVFSTSLILLFFSFVLLLGAIISLFYLPKKWIYFLNRRFPSVNMFKIYDTLMLLSLIVLIVASFIQFFSAFTLVPTFQNYYFFWQPELYSSLLLFLAMLATFSLTDWAESINKKLFLSTPLLIMQSIILFL